METNIEIRTTRFLLRTLSDEDATKKYLNWMNDEAVKKFIEPANRPQNLVYLKNYINEKFYKSDCLFLGIFTIKKNIHIGNIKYEPIDFNKSSATMGVLLGESKWRGKNVFEEVLMASSKYLKENYEIKKINLGVKEKNTSALKAYKKLGFKRNSSYKDDKGETIFLMYYRI